MSKKMYALLLPVLAIAAMAMGAGSAQAAVHWFKCEHSAAKTHKYTDSSCSVENTKKEGEYERVELPLEKEGKLTKLHVKTFGVLTLLASTGAEAKCFVDDHGRIWNKSAATNGLDEIQVFENYECVSNFCSAGLELIAEGLPWQTELAPGTPPTDKITGIKIRLKCTTPATNVLFEGSLTPTFVNGTQMNGGTSFTHFENLAGLTAAGGVTATVSGNDYVIGVENAEQILVF